MSKDLVQSGALELVRAGIISYRQLNEVHRTLSETGGNLDDLLVEKGYATRDQLKLRHRTGKRKTLKLARSLDLVKAGLLTFKQLNLCHRDARREGDKTILEVAVDKGYLTDLQVATLPTGEDSVTAKQKKNKRFSSSWDLFRAGVVTLKALNECHRYIKLDAPEKSLKEALLERGYVSPEQIEALGGEVPATPEDPSAAPRMDQTIVDLDTPVADVSEQAKEPKQRKPRTQPAAGGATILNLEDDLSADDPRADQTLMDADDQGAPEDFRADQTMMDAGDEGAPEDFRADQTLMDADEGAEEDADFRAARTYMDAGDEVPEEDDFRAARTFMDAGDEVPEEDDPRAAHTMMDAGEDDPRAAHTLMDAGEDDPRAAHTMMDADEAGSDPDFRAARTFMDTRAGEDTSDPDFRAARTFMDAGDGTSDPDMRSARTFLDAGDGTSDPDMRAARTFLDSDHNLNVGDGGTFMDVGQEPAPEAAGGQTFMDVAAGGPTEESTTSAQEQTAHDAEGTFMDVGEQTSTGSRSGVSRGTDSRTNADVAGDTRAGSTASRTGATSVGRGSSRGGSRTQAERDSQQARRKGGKKGDDAYSHPLVGKVIGGCRIRKKLGEGGMGAVFLAEHLKLKRQSVIKVIPAHLSSNRQLIARFEREAQAAAVIQHPNVVSVYNVGEENGVHFIEMEYVDGKGLDALMKEKKVLEQMEAVKIIRACCKGLAQAHKGGIVHRDIKPDNIMLTRKGQVKIADFGLARAAQSEQAELTRAGQILGTPAYMSPEQCQAQPTDQRCDIYSLGATFYAMITGKRPFTGKSVVEIMQKHVEQDPISPRDYNPDLSPTLARIVLRMMAKAPEDRHQSADEVIESLDRFLREEGTDRLNEIQALIGDDYRLIKKLGQGGMGAVYSARTQKALGDLEPETVVAIKVLSEDVSEEDVKRFELEAQLATQVTHDGVIHVLGHKIGDPINYIVMEYVEGESVRDLLRRQERMPEPEVRRVLREVLQALAAAHEQKIIHRDIKPDNIMLAQPNQRVKIADFGVAKRADSTTEVTQAGFLVGTPHYMSPEQCCTTGDYEVTTQADIYSLGATAYYMATGKKPFEGETQPAIILQHLKEKPVAPNEVVEELSEALSNLILNMLAKKPARRYATVQDVLNDLQRVDSGGQVKKRKGIETPLEDTGAAAKRSLAIAGLVAVVVIVVAALGLNYRQKSLEIENQQAAERKLEDNRTKLKELYDGGQAEVGGLIRDCQFADAGSALKKLRETLQQTDNSEGKAEVGKFNAGLVTLSKEIADKRVVRDREVEIAWSATQAEPRATFERELGALRESLAGFKQRTKAALGGKGHVPPMRPRDFTTNRLHEAARSYLSALDGVGAATFGDSPRVAESLKATGELREALNAVATDMWTQLEADIEHRYIDMRFYVTAREQVDNFRGRWATEVISLKVRALTTSDQRRQELLALEKSFASKGDVVQTRNAFEDAVGTLAKGLGLLQLPHNSERLEHELGSSAALEDANRSVAFVPEVLTQLEEVQTLSTDPDATTYLQQARNLRSALRDQRKTLVDGRLVNVEKQLQGLAKTGKFRTALGTLDRQLSELRDIYRDDDEEDLARRRRELDAKLDEQRAGIRQSLGRQWREQLGKLRKLTWEVRDFQQADRTLKAVAENLEYDVELVPGEPTPQQQGAAERERLKPYLKGLALGGNAGVRFPAGSYAIGTERSDSPKEGPVHQVAIGALGVDRREVTVREFREFLRSANLDGSPRNAEGPGPLAGRHPRTVFDHPDAPLGGYAPDYMVVREELPDGGQRLRFADLDTYLDRPVVFVSWYAAYAFARWAGKRLPSEAEWEAIASANPSTGERSAYPWGDTFSHDRLVSSAEYGANWRLDDLPSAGSKLQGVSPCGALDMAGSVSEWTDSAYLAYDPARHSADRDFGSRYRAVRGGAFTDHYANAFRCAFRGRAQPGEAAVDLGFRCVWGVSGEGR